MTTRYDAGVNGVPLSSLDDRIIVTDIREGIPRTRTTTAERPVNAGSLFIRQNRQSLSVTVAFVLWERDVAERKALLERVKEWASVGDVVRLTVNDRSGQYLNARVTDPPAIESALHWTQEIRMVFVAYETPYWKDEAYVEVTTQGSTATEMTVPGIGESFVEVDVQNTGIVEIKSVRIGVGIEFMEFNDISLGMLKTLNVGYDDLGILFAKIDGKSVLPSRTTDSSDDLVIPCRTPVLVNVNTVPSTGTGFNVKAVFKAQGVHA